MELGNEESNNFQVLLFSENHKEYLSNDNLKFNMNFKKNVQTFSADNVAAIFRGSEFPDEYVILTAHLDHVGIQNGDIYNGAQAPKDPRNFLSIYNVWISRLCCN